MSASAGRVLLIFKGDYESATTYKPMDVVVYGVNSYVCILESTGNIPTNTTYWQTLAKGISNMSPEAIGIGYGLSQNTGASKTATLADYTLTINGIVAVTFADDVPANATLNINSQGAKAIYYRGSALVANVIRGGDTVTFAYDGTRYNVLCIDGGAGHEIENSAGTKLTQRDVLAFKGGLKATDDSTNQKTLIDDTPDYIDWTNWDAMSDSDKNAYIASHNKFAIDNLPDTEGVINAEYMTLLWENPNTTQAFAAQTITLSSADYDSLRAYFVHDVSSSSARVLSIEFAKGKNSMFELGSQNYTRAINYVSDTSLYFDSGYSGATQNNSKCVPIAIYGIKASFQFKVNAIATELSTRADHCFLSDDVTTVEDAITYKDVYSTDEHIVGKWIDGSDLYYKTIDCGALPNATNKNVAHGISNLYCVISIEGIAVDPTSSKTFKNLPFPIASGTGAISLYVDDTYIRITTTNDQRGYNGYITLRYTKTS